jgi:hypothetical protein
LKTDGKLKAHYCTTLDIWMLLVLDVLLIVFYYLLLRVFSVCLSLYSMYVTVSISIGLYPNLDLWNAIKLHYTTVHVCSEICPLCVVTSLTVVR